AARDADAGVTTVADSFSTSAASSLRGAIGDDINISAVDEFASSTGSSIGRSAVDNTASGARSAARSAARSDRPEPSRPSSSSHSSGHSDSRGSAEDDGRSVGCPTKNSFYPSTLVLMADGTTLPIKDITVGDKVTATDPVTGKTVAEPVIQL